MSVCTVLRGSYLKHDSFLSKQFHDRHSGECCLLENVLSLINLLDDKYPKHKLITIESYYNKACVTGSGNENDHIK